VLCRQGPILKGFLLQQFTNVRIKLERLSFVPGKPFQHSLMFEGKAGDYPIEAPFSFYTLLSPTNIRLG